MLRKAGTATNCRLWNWLAVPGLPTADTPPVARPIFIPSDEASPHNATVPLPLAWPPMGSVRVRPATLLHFAGAPGLAFWSGVAWIVPVLSNAAPATARLADHKILFLMNSGQLIIGGIGMKTVTRYCLAGLIVLATCGLMNAGTLGVATTPGVVYANTGTWTLGYSFEVNTSISVI